MTIDDLTKEYLMHTFDFKNGSATDFVVQYSQIRDEVKTAYTTINSERQRERNKAFHNK